MELLFNLSLLTCDWNGLTAESTLIMELAFKFSCEPLSMLVILIC